MTLIKKRDVKEHFAARRRARTHRFMPPDQHDATGIARTVPDAIPANSAGFINDFVGEHSSAVVPIMPGKDEGLGTL
jgi:hypothetical protein